jgi:hypothetical protein
VRGKTTTVDHWKVNQAGETPPITTPFTTTTTTTTTKDPPTAIAIVASESPAIVGDVITYSMTVANVLTATQGAVYMTDNGVTLPNCSGPVATNQGSLSYVCDVTYTDVGSHLIVGVFLGDTVYGQSAGQLTEAVQMPTTTTTTLPAPLVTVSISARGENGVVQTSEISVGTDSYDQFGVTGPGIGVSIVGSWNYQMPTGGETLYANGALIPLCTMSLVAVCVMSDGQGGTTGLEMPGIDSTEWPCFFTPGTYTITATYSGDATYPSAQSNAVTVTVTAS